MKTTELDGVLYQLTENGIGLFTGSTPDKDSLVSYATVIPIIRSPQTRAQPASGASF